MVKAIVIKDLDGKPLYVAEVKELTINELVDLKSEAQRNQNEKVKEYNELKVLLSETHSKAKELEQQLKVDHGELEVE